MLDNMFEKLQAMQGQVEETKKRLETVIVEAQAEGVVVKINGNRKIQDVQIPEDLMGDKEAMDLVRSYYAIPENQRRRLFELARVLSDVA